MAEDRMRRLAQFVLIAFLPVLASTALAVDRGQFVHVPPDIRARFKSVMAPSAVPCCDAADGHRTTYDVRCRADGVPIQLEWPHVPDRAVMRARGNQTGQ